MAETADAALGEAEYRAIESTFGETARGRLFLAEFARRSRKADIAGLVTTMERLKADASSPNEAEVERLKASLAEMVSALEEGTGTPAPSGFEGLATALREAESATSDILDAAEHIQEIAWTLRERGTDRGICDLLDGRSSEIYAACALHDAGVKRIGQALRTGRLLEERIASLCETWGVRRPAPSSSPPLPAEADEAAPSPAPVVETPTETVATAAPAIAEETPSPAEVPEQPAPVPEPAQAGAENPVSARRRKQLEALAEIDSLGIREKLNLFT